MINIELKSEYANKKICDLTFGELFDIINDIVDYHVRRNLNINTGRYDFQKGYFVGDKPPFDWNTPICTDSIDKINKM